MDSFLEWRVTDVQSAGQNVIRAPPGGSEWSWSEGGGSNQRPYIIETMHSYTLPM